MAARYFTSSDGVRMFYDDSGPADGTPLVICHGIAVNGSQFTADAAWFAARGYRVLLPDLRGHGRSGVPDPLTAESLTIARLGADMLEMLDHAGLGSVHWVGNSLGGIVGLGLLAAGRFRTFTTFGTTYRIRTMRALSAWVVRAGYAFWGRGLLAVLASFVVSNDRQARRKIAEMAGASNGEVTALVAHNVTDYDFIAEAQRAGMPIMLLRCGGDRYINAALGRTLRAMRGRANFTLTQLPTGGHCANLDAPEEFRRAVLGFIEKG